jgi:hypothetical protein
MRDEEREDRRDVEEQALESEQRSLLAALAGARGDCPANDELLAYSGGELAGEARRAVERHLLLCSDCEQLVELAGEEPASVDDASWRRMERRLDRRTGVPWESPRHGWRWLRVAAVLTAVVGVSWLLTLRSEAPVSPTRGASPGLVAPTGSVDRVDELVWKAPPLVHSFRVEVRRDGALLFTAEASASPFRPPAPLLDRLVPGHRYTWRVEGLDVSGTRVFLSGWAAFEIASDGQP